MSLYQKKSIWHYQFMKASKRFNGTCENCHSEKEAKAYEKRMKEEAAAVKAEEKTAAEQEKFHKAALKRIQSKRNKIMLAGAFDLTLAKTHKKQSAEKNISSKREVWGDFVAFMAERYPEAADLASVTESQTSEYIQLIRTEGRFQKTVTYQRNGKTITRPAICKPSSRTSNLYLTTCREVFALLAKDAGVTENPFDGIDRLGKEEETHEIFTDEEIQLIHEKADTFLYTLFFVAENTGMREGDICTLQWDEIRFAPNGRGFIRRVMNKTGKLVEIPLTRELFDFLRERYNDIGKDDKYCFPEHAKMYLENKSGISYRIKDFLENECGIKTTRTPKGRTHAISVKDLHSMRHTFAHKLEQAGVPLTVIQQLVGHSSTQMTAHYSGHNTLSEKSKAMAKLEAPADTATIETTSPSMLTSAEPERDEAHRILDNLSIDDIREFLKIYGR